MNEKKSSYERVKKYRFLQRKKVKYDEVQKIESEKMLSESNNFIDQDNSGSINPLAENNNFIVEELDSVSSFQNVFEDINCDFPIENPEINLSSEITTTTNVSSSSEYESEAEGEAVEEYAVQTNISIIDKKLDLREKLALWSTKNITHLPHTVVNELLELLRSEGHHELPKTAETLLKTKRTNGAVTEMLSKNHGLGEYVYLGIKQGLESRITNSNYNENKLQVIVNIDGLPLFNKSKISATPILMAIIHEDYQCAPFLVALYSGKSKPDSVNEFLDDFVKEASDLIINGVEIENKKYEFELKGMACDTLARAFIKCTKGHTGFCACERCEIIGKSVKKNKNNSRSYTRVYPDINCPLRTKTSFKKQSQPQHHLPGEKSPLLRIKKFDPVRGVLLENMHLLTEGAMKFLLEKMLHGSGGKFKLNTENRKLLSEQFDQLSYFVPTEFQRKVFCLDELVNWKATQFRFVLLYAGPLVFRRVLAKDQYRHFLKLHCACRILFHKFLALERVDEAEQLLREFVLDMPKFYGKSSQVMNIHNLIHLADDVRYMEAPLSSYSAFPFENYLGKLKPLVRSGINVASQIVRRISEIEAAGTKKLVSYPVISNPEKQKKKSSNSYLSIQIKKFQICNSHPNNIVKLKNGQFFQILKIKSKTSTLDLNNFFIKGFFISKVKQVFKKPIDSQGIGIYKIEELPNTNEGSLITVCMAEVKTKCLLMSFQTNSYIVTLLHV